jgi:hypothetical protein
MTKETRELIAFARKHRYERAEGFVGESITIELPENVIEWLEAKAKALAELADISYRDAESALMNKFIEGYLKEMKPIFLENMNGGGI